MQYDNTIGNNDPHLIAQNRFDNQQQTLYSYYPPMFPPPPSPFLQPLSSLHHDVVMNVDNGKTTKQQRIVCNKKCKTFTCGLCSGLFTTLTIEALIVFCILKSH